MIYINYKDEKGHIQTIRTENEATMEYELNNLERAGYEVVEIFED